MKFLYLGVDPVDFSSELFRRDIFGKFGGVRQLGHEVDYICRDEGGVLCSADGSETRFSFSGTRNRTGDFLQFVLSFLKDRVYDFLYMKSRLLYAEQERIAQSVKMKKFGAKVIYEPEIWPMEEYCRNLLRKNRGGLEGLAKNICVRRMMLCQRARASDFYNWVDTAVVFGVPARDVWGIPAISESTGISVRQIRMRSSIESLEEPITMLAVVDDPFLCGFERLFRGLNVYRERNFREPVTLDIVGGEAETAGLRAAAEKLNMGSCVRFLGAKSTEEIAEACGTHSVAVSNLGLYRADRIYDSPFLTKLFCAAGIPFVYACEDVGLGTKVPFALKMPNLDAPVNVELICEFVWRCRYNAGLALQERRFAENHYDWRIIMKQILLFTATGKLEA